MLSADTQTNKQTNQRYQKHNLLCQGGNNQSCLGLCSNMYEFNTVFYGLTGFQKL